MQTTIILKTRCPNCNGVFYGRDKANKFRRPEEIDFTGRAFYGTLDIPAHDHLAGSFTSDLTRFYCAHCITGFQFRFITHRRPGGRRFGSFKGVREENRCFVYRLIS